MTDKQVIIDKLREQLRERFPAAMAVSSGKLPQEATGCDAPASKQEPTRNLIATANRVRECMSYLGPTILKPQSTAAFYARQSDQ